MGLSQKLTPIFSLTVVLLINIRVVLVLRLGAFGGKFRLGWIVFVEIRRKNRESLTVLYFCLGDYGGHVA